MSFSGWPPGERRLLRSLPALLFWGKINLGVYMANCETCKKSQSVPESVPYIAHEASMARMERQVKRLWITVLALIAMLVATNGAWIWYESQFSDIETTIEAEQDGSGVNIVSGGDLDYGAESKDNNP